MGLSWKTTIMSTVLDTVHSPKKVLIVDCSPEARALLAGHLTNYCPDHRIVGQADSVAEAFRLVRETRPDLLFLDVELADGTAFGLLDKLRGKNFQSIFTTASEEFALKAFKYSAVDYLLKPISPEDFTQAVDRAVELQSQRVQHLLQMMKTPEHLSTFEKLALPSQEGLTMMALEDIVRLQSDGGYTTFWSRQGESCLVSRSIGEYESFLPNGNFLRVHTSHMLNLDFVKKFLREDGGFALMCDGSRVPIARRRKEYFLDMLRGKSVFA